MKGLPWIVAGVGIGAAITYVLFNQPSVQHATGSDTLENAAGNTFAWGTKQRFTGKGINMAGKIKEGLGRITGDDDLAGEGVVDQVAGTVKDSVGQFAHAAGQTIHDLNQ
jgi:uncharacterized protein YjbJ (UPF0337 family)